MAKGSTNISGRGLYDEEEKQAGSEVFSVKNIPVIGVCGARSRIGATTIALQIAAYYHFNGKKACYVEMNETGFIEKAVALYAGFEKQNDGAYRYMNNSCVFFLAPQGSLQRVLKSDYDVLIYDYGTAALPSFDSTSYVACNVQIVVAGVKPSEWNGSLACLKRTIFDNSVFLFNYVPIDDAETILKGMTNRKGRSYCITDYIGDYFSSVEQLDTIFRKIIPVLGGDSE